MTSSTVTLAPRTGQGLARGTGDSAETLPGSRLDSETVTSALDRSSRADYWRWQNHIRPAAGCTQPVRLTGRIRRVQVDTSSGGVLNETTRSTTDMPDGAIYKACGNRRTSVCPSCAEIYRADAYQLVLAGLRGGKGIPEAVGGHPAVFMTLTAPSFGPVHTQRTTAAGKPAPCRARRRPDICPHGIDLRCYERHQDGDHRLGHALCLDCYNYGHHAVWNIHAPELWRRTTICAHRVLEHWAKDHGHTEPVRISFGKVAEFQRRGLVHYHVLARFDGIEVDDKDAIVTPPAWANSFVLTWILREAAERTHFQTPELLINQRDKPELSINQPDGWSMSWGEQADIRPVNLRGTDPLTDERVTEELGPGGRRRILSGQAVAGYLAKYATKATETTGYTSRRITPDTIDAYTTPTHIGRVIQAAWTLGRRSSQEGWDKTRYAKLRHWAHMLGYGGHFFTKSRRYTTTFRQLRQARIDYRRAIFLAREHLDDNHDLIDIAELTYQGTGWHTTGDALLANTSAALARSQRQAAKEALDTYVSSGEVVL
ncbi:replication initiator protein RepSA [Flindersiella endophytica]